MKIDHPYYLTEATMEAFLKPRGVSPCARSTTRATIFMSASSAPRARPSPTRLPSAKDVRDFFREVRAVQNRVPPPGP